MKVEEASRLCKSTVLDCAKSPVAKKGEDWTTIGSELGMPVLVSGEDP